MKYKLKSFKVFSSFFVGLFALVMIFSFAPLQKAEATSHYNPDCIPVPPGDDNVYDPITGNVRGKEGDFNLIPEGAENNGWVWDGTKWTSDNPLEEEIFPGVYGRTWLAVPTIQSSKAIDSPNCEGGFGYVDSCAEYHSTATYSVGYNLKFTCDDHPGVIVSTYNGMGQDATSTETSGTLGPIMNGTVKVQDGYNETPINVTVRFANGAAVTKDGDTSTTFTGYGCIEFDRARNWLGTFIQARDNPLNPGQLEFPNESNIYSPYEWFGPSCGGSGPGGGGGGGTSGDSPVHSSPSNPSFPPWLNPGTGGPGYPPVPPTTSCDNGATNYPTCTTNSSGGCINGATNPTACTTNPTVGSDGKCLNGATNPPTCTPPPAPNLTIINTWGIPNLSQSGMTFAGAQYGLSWGAVSNATSCTLDGSTASISGGTTSGTASGFSKVGNNHSRTFTLTCTNSIGVSASSSATISYPPPPTNVSGSCNVQGTTGTISWTQPSGYNTFYTRATLNGQNHNPGWDEAVVGTSKSFSTTPGNSYAFWIHSKYTPNAAWSDPVSGTINCPTPQDPSGTISATNCTIPNGSSGCSDTNVTWSTDHRVNGATTAVTKNNPPSQTQLSTATSGTNVDFAVNRGTTTFFLYHNAGILAQVAINADCASTSTWNGTQCVSISPPVCSAIHYGCQSGTSSNNTLGETFWTWNCTNTANVSVACSENIPTPSTPTYSCAANGTSATISWNLPSPHTLSYFRSTGQAYDIPEDRSDTGPSTTIPVTPGQGYSAWVHTRVLKPGGPYDSYSMPEKSVWINCPLPPSGGISATDCTIASGAGSCVSSINWNTSNPKSGFTSAVTTPTNITVGNGNSGSTTYSIVPGPGTRTFYLYHDGVELAKATATATCVSGTTWNTGSNTCVTTVVTPATPIDLNANARACDSGTIDVSWDSSPGATSYQLRDGSTIIYNGPNTSFVHTGLTAGSPHSYTVRASNSAGSSPYSSSSVDRTAPPQCPLDPPTVTTNACTNITQTSATSGGNIISNGGAAVTVSGIAWNTSANPTTTNSKTTDGWAIGGPWSSNLTGLSGTTYYVRAYATNSAGTGYGANVTCALPLDGGWSDWSACSATACGTTGTQTRTCTNPSPQNGGADCSGLDGGSPSQTCSAPACAADLTVSSISLSSGTNSSGQRYPGPMTLSGVVKNNSSASITLPSNYMNIFKLRDGSEPSWTAWQAWVNAPFASLSPLDGSATRNVASYSWEGASGMPNRTTAQYSFGLCADQAPIPNGVVSESSETNNCAGLTVTFTNPVLSVAKAGAGSGTVISTSVPSLSGQTQINCGTACSNGFPYHPNSNGSYSTVTLTATPASGSTFTGWSGACSGTGACNVLVNQDKSVTATFGIIPPLPGTPTVSASTPACSANPGKINLGFSQAAGGTTTDYYLYRSPANTALGPSNAVQIQHENSLSDLVSPDSGLTAGATYQYQMRVVGPGGERFSEIVSASANAECIVLLPDLTAAAPTPATATVGADRTFSSSIVNLGSANASGTITHLFQFDENNEITTKTTTTTTTISPSANPTVSATYRFNTVGTHRVRVCADNNASFVGTVTESNEGNNCSSWTNVTAACPSDTTWSGSDCVPTAKPDLTTTISLSKTNPVQGENVTVTGNIKNITGVSFSGNFSNALYYRTGSTYNAWSALIPNPISNPGTSPGTNVSYTWPAGAVDNLDYYFKICADSGSAIDEGTNENNNCAETTSPLRVVVASLPDLTAAAPTPATATVGADRTFSSSIVNLGSANASGTITHLFQFDENNEITTKTTTTTTTISPSANPTVSATYRFNTVGTHRVRVCADNNALFIGTVSESNENDNCSYDLTSTGGSGGWTQVIVSCPTGTTWNGASCNANLVMSGTLTGPASCTVAQNASRCTANLAWSVTNPVTTPTAITAAESVSPSYPALNISVSDSTSPSFQSGNQLATVPYGGRTFYLYNNAKELARTTVTASCGSGSWNPTSKKCTAGGQPPPSSSPGGGGGNNCTGGRVAGGSCPFSSACSVQLTGVWNANCDDCLRQGPGSVCPDGDPGNNPGGGQCGQGFTGTPPDCVKIKDPIFNEG